MSVLALSVRDETTAGEVLADLELQLSSATLTVADLIRERVHQEVRRHNAQTEIGSDQRFFGLVQPDAPERELNAAAKPRGRRIDAERQTAVALDAFQRGQVLLLVDDRQVTDPKQQVSLNAGSSVVFLKLVPLVGG